MPGEDDARGGEVAVWRAETGGDCPGGRDAFALGESDAERVWARGDRGQCAGIASDHRQRPEEGPGGRGEVGALRASGPTNLTTDKASRRGGASGSGGDPSAGRAGEDTDAIGELGSGSGEIVRIPDAELFDGTVRKAEQRSAGEVAGAPGWADGRAGARAQ